MDGDAREISVYDLSVIFCLQSYGIEHVARCFDLSGYIALKNARNANGVAGASPCCKPYPTSHSCWSSYASMSAVRPVLLFFLQQSA